ncbi:unnamed protein product, partial [marine sediment metagenome]
SSAIKDSIVIDNPRQNISIITKKPAFKYGLLIRIPVNEDGFEEGFEIGVKQVFSDFLLIYSTTFRKDFGTLELSGSFEYEHPFGLRSRNPAHRRLFLCYNMGLCGDLFIVENNWDDFILKFSGSIGAGWYLPFSVLGTAELGITEELYQRLYRSYPENYEGLFLRFSIVRFFK